MAVAPALLVLALVRPVAADNVLTVAASGAVDGIANTMRSWTATTNISGA
jgi:hypothetical protein